MSNHASNPVATAAPPTSNHNPHYADMTLCDRPADIPEHSGNHRFAGAWIYPATGNTPPLCKARYDGPSAGKGKPQKTMLWFHAEAGDEWVAGLGGHTAPLYGVHTIRPGNPCFVCEGEKAAAALHCLDVPAVAIPGTASAATVDLAPLDGLDLILWPDNDKAGADCMDKLAERLRRGHRRIDPSMLDLPEKGDAADLVVSCDGERDLLRDLLSSAVVDVPAPPPPEPMGRHLPDDWFNASIPPREFVFRDMLPIGAVSLLVATGGTGKSMLSLEMAATATTGRALMSCIEPTAGPSKVALLALEDEEREIHRRLKRVAQAFNLERDSTDLVAVARNLRLFCLPAFTVCSIGRDGMLNRSEAMERLAAELAEFQPRLVIADPLAGLLGGVVEEASNEAAQAVIGLLRAAMPPGAALLVCAHTSKAERMLSTTARGASAWMDASRQVLALRPPDNGDGKILGDEAPITVILEMTKSNYSPLATPVYLQRCVLPDFAGVLKPFDFADCKQRAAQARTAEIGDAVLGALAESPVTMKEAWPRGNDEARARGDAFIVALNVRAGRDIPRTDRMACLKTMLDDGRIVRYRDGKRDVLIPAATDRSGDSDA